MELEAIHPRQRVQIVQARSLRRYPDDHSPQRVGLRFHYVTDHGASPKVSFWHENQGRSAKEAVSAFLL